MSDAHPPEWPQTFDAEPPRGPRGWTLVAWAVILAVCGFLFLSQRLVEAEGDPAAATSSGGSMMEIQARYLVGAADMAGVHGNELYEQAGVLNAGPVGQRLRFVTLAGELAGPDEAIRVLGNLERTLDREQVEPTPEQRRLLDILRRLYSDLRQQRFDAPSVNELERALMERELGWFGRLALAPRQHPDADARARVIDPAHETVLVIVSALLIAGVLTLIGLVGLFVFLTMAANRNLGGGLETGVHAEPPPAEPPTLIESDAPGRSVRVAGHAGVYAETFAAWLLLFVGLQVAAALAPKDERFIVMGFAMILSLSALFWPVFRGVPWAQVREEIGLTLGRQPTFEPVAGVTSYVLTLPLLAVALVITLLLIMGAEPHQDADGPEQPQAVQADQPPQGKPEAPPPGNGQKQKDSFVPDTGPSHPLTEMLGEAWSWQWWQIFLLGAVIAPLVEETMFRGVLYRHLREASAGLGYTGSVVLSMLLNGFLFAVVHPQGPLGIPVLMALAIGFCLAREWRGSLIAPMVAHGLNNGAVLILLTLAGS